MKFTIFGLTLSSSWGNGHATPYRALLRALHRLGHEITFYERNVEYYSLRRDFCEVPWCKLVLYPSWDEIRALALSEAAASDVVITGSYCPEGSRINDEILALERPLRVFYDLDTPVTLARLRAAGRGNISALRAVDYVRRDQIAAFDLVLSWTGGAALSELQTEFGARMARPLFGSIDPDDYRRTAPRHIFECALSYMGTYAADRQEKLNSLFLEPARQRPTTQFLLAGALYPWQWEWPPNVRRFDHIAPADHPALYSSSRLTLSLTRAEMVASGFCPSGRLFEAAACGTPIVSDWFSGLDAFFTPGVEILIASSSNDMLKALDLAPEELARIAAAARERTLQEHTGAHRAATLLSILEEARGAHDYSQHMEKSQTPRGDTPHRNSVEAT